MADLPSFIPFGVVGGHGTGTQGLSATTLDSNDDYLVTVFRVPPGGGNRTITRLGVHIATVTGTPPTYKISLQGVAADGQPDDTIKGGGSPASKTFTPVAGGANTFTWFTLDNSYSAAPGELLALVVGYDSGTINSSNKIAIVGTLSSSATHSPPYTIYRVNGAAGSRQNATSASLFGWGTATTAYGLPVHAAPNATFSNATTPDEYGLKFTWPSGVGTSFTVAGITARFTQAAANAGLRVTLYDADGAILQRVDWDADAVQALSPTADMKAVLFDEAALTALTPGVVYRIGILSLNGSNTTYRELTLLSADDMDALSMGQAWHKTTRTNGSDAGAWTDVTTIRPAIALLVSDISATAGGGGTGGHKIIGG